MASFFNVGALGGNPFSTPVGQRIEKATDSSLESENWALNMEICDMINESSDAARDAMKAIRKRLTQNAGKNYAVIMYTLTVLETCVKNCGKAFHISVANKEFIQELVKLIGPKNDPPTEVQEKVLNLIQMWAEAFKNQPDLNGVVQVYQELKNKGIEFPMSDMETTAPIFTPQRSVPESSPPVATQPISPQHGGQVVPVNPTLVAVPASLTTEQISKLQSELDIVSMNMSILGEMLTELKPGQEDPSEYKLLNDLTQTCKEMQGRIVELIGRVNHDEITAELLRLNDELNNLFLRHQRYEKNRDPNISTTPSAVLGAVMGVPGTAYSQDQAKDSLIDLGNEAPGEADKLPAQFGSLDLGTASSQLSKIDTVTAMSGASIKPTTVDEFDILAKSRNTAVDSGKTGREFNTIEKSEASSSSGAHNIPELHQSYETDFDEMAAWLSSHDIAPEEAVTSTEFDKFLAERAAAAETLPILSTSQPSSADEARNTTRQKKTSSKKDDENLLAI